MPIGSVEQQNFVRVWLYLHSFIDTHICVLVIDFIESVIANCKSAFPLRLFKEKTMRQRGKIKD